MLQENEHCIIPTFDDWKAESTTKSPHFQYWASVLDLKLMCLCLVIAIRAADFTLNLDTVRKILLWMFAVDHVCRGVIKNDSRV
jgi:hypothetical protein